MTVNKWQKPLILNNCNMNIIEIKNNFSLEKVKKKCWYCYCWFSKSRSKWFPDKYIKNITFKICNITCEVKKNIY